MIVEIRRPDAKTFADFLCGKKNPHGRVLNHETVSGRLSFFISVASGGRGLTWPGGRYPLR